MTLTCELFILWRRQDVNPHTCGPAWGMCALEGESEVQWYTQLGGDTSVH